MLPYNYNKKLGYYKVGDEEFSSRNLALLASAKLDNPPHINFVFNNLEFSKFNWKIEPTESLNELYRQRALQLREKYDYLILAFTGGSDSWVILDSFLSNGIHIDELVHYAPISAMQNQEFNSHDFSPLNVGTEYHLTTKPQLEQIAKQHPEIKITICDWAKQGDKAKLSDDWVVMRSVNLTGQINNRWALEDKTDSVWKKKNIGYIQGLEKPRLCIKDGKYCVYFLDFVHLQTISPEEYTNDHWTTEYFYWSPDSEKILRKQAHTIKNFFEANPIFKPYINWPISNPKNRTFYESLIKGLIYPRYDLSWFQINKPATFITLGQDSLLSPVNNTLRKDWQGGIDELLSNVEDRYKTKDNDLVGFVSDFYEI